MKIHMSTLYYIVHVYMYIYTHIVYIYRACIRLMRDHPLSFNTLYTTYISLAY